MEPQYTNASNESGKSELGAIAAPQADDHSDDIDRQIAAMSPEEYAKAEKKMKLKMDFQVVTLAGLLYLMSFLDRTNIGSARVLGILTDLNMSVYDFRVALTVLYPTYIAFEIPSNLALKKIGPARLIPALVVSWGLVCTLQGIVTSKTGLYINRVFLGMTEAGLLPGLILYLTFFYKPGEIQLRQALYFSGASMAGAFGGLIAAGISRIDHLGWNPWRWLFVIEGVLTIAIGLICFFIFPNGPDKLKGLTAVEKRIALNRIGKGSGQDYAAEQKHEALGHAGPAGSAEIQRETAKFHWRVFYDCFTDPFVLLLAVASLASALNVFGIAFFSPTIVRSMGISTNPTTVLLLTVPPFVFAFCTAIAMGFFCDRARLRGAAVLIGFLLCVIGYSIAYSSAVVAAQYVGLVIMSMGAYGIPPVLFTWSSLGTWSHYKRAVTIALMIIFSNSGAIASTWLTFPSTGNVARSGGFLVSLAMSLVGIAATVALETFIWWERKQKSSGKRDWKIQKAQERFPGATHDQIREYLGDQHPEFRREY